MKKLTLLIGVPLALGLVALVVAAPPWAVDAPERNDNPRVVLHTTEGDIVIEMYVDEAPLATARFMDNTARGVFDGTIFHDVSVDMVYGGVRFADGTFQGMFYGNPPPSEEDNGLTHRRGSVGTVEYDPDYQSGEFYVALCAIPHFDGKLTIFGEVLAGMDIVEHVAASAPEGGCMPEKIPPLIVTITGAELLGTR